MSPFIMETPVFQSIVEDLFRMLKYDGNVARHNV